jgi:xanthine dehydrogenase accessory factor
MMSSRPRRDRMYEELRSEGVNGAQIDRVRSPVGMDTGGATDTEIAVGIVAEMLRFKKP